MSLIIPTILTSDSKELLHKLNLIKGKIGLVQIDIIDGIFAPKKTIGLKDLANRPEGINIELHLMVDRPEDWVEEAAKIKSTGMVAQVEMMDDPEKYFTLAAEAGIQAGVGIDLPTDLNIITPEVFVWAEKILLMGVKAGEGGQEFDESVLHKIEPARSHLAGTRTIVVDGGLNEETIALCAEAGAREFCVGTVFWESDDLLKRYKELEYIARKGRWGNKYQ